MDVQFRQLAINSSLLHPQPIAPRGMIDSLKVIEHLGYVQIDTISVVERAHHHILWNRVQNYDKEHLNRLLADQKIFEYWFHAASYIPMRDYRYALRQMNSVRRGESKYFNRGDSYLMQEILAQAKSEGQVCSRDFLNKNEKTVQGWWKSSIVRKSIEQLYMQGELMVCKRVGVEKFYALAENCLPSGLDLTEPSVEEYARYLFETVKRSHGVFTWKQLLHLKSGTELKIAMRSILNEQIDAKMIESVQLDSGEWLYVDLEKIDQFNVTEKSVKILSPFDNLVIHRDRLMALFNFDYRLECYVAPEKRQYGYFCLPILYGAELVGKIDCKAHRGEGILEILSFHLQAIINNKAHFIELLSTELERFAAFNHCVLDLQFQQKLNFN